MPYRSMTEVPEALKTAGLTLSQANDWSRYFDDAKKQEDVENPGAIAWTRFKLKYKKSGDKWVAKSNSATFSSGVGNIVFNSVDNNITKFSFIVQTEGTHTDMFGKQIRYTPEVMSKFGESIVSKGVYDDPRHTDGDYRLLGAEFANIIGYEIKKINNDMATEFGIDSSLLDKSALIAHAEGFKPDYNYLIQNNKIKYYSSEFNFVGEQGDDGVYNLDYVDYVGVVALSSPGADPGAIFLEIYNSKYGGNKMTDEEKEKAKNDASDEGAEEPNKGEEGTTETTGEDKPNEEGTVAAELEEQKTSNAKLAEEKKTLEETVTTLETKNTELETKNAELSKGEFSLESAEKEIKVLNDKRGELEEKVSNFGESEKKIESLNAQLKELRDEKRTTVLSEHIKNSEMVESIIKQDLDEEAFNSKIKEIELIKKEAMNEAGNNAGIAPTEALNAISDSFEKDWGMTKEDMVKNIVNKGG